MMARVSREIPAWQGRLNSIRPEPESRSTEACVGDDLGRSFLSKGRGSLWRERVERDPLAGSGAQARRREAKAVGGDRRSEDVERHGDAIRSLVDETPELTLEESGRRSSSRVARIS
jgi:hypothetical protein